MIDLTAELVRVLVVDDHAVVRAGLRSLLEPEEGLALIDEAASEESILRAIEHQPEIILLDVSMPDVSGIDVIPNLLEASPSSKVLVLSMHDEPGYVREAFAAGARGYILKETADAELITAIRDVAAGGRYVNAALGARLVAAQASEVAEAAANPLSERESEVLRLLALGHTNQQIDRALHLGSHGGDAPGSHHAEAPSRVAR